MSEKINEFILLGLRRIEEVDLKRLREDLNFDPEKEKKEEIINLVKMGFLKKEKDIFKAYPKGYFSG